MVSFALLGVEGAAAECETPFDTGRVFCPPPRAPRRLVVCAVTGVTLRVTNFGIGGLFCRRPNDLMMGAFCLTAIDNVREALLAMDIQEKWVRSVRCGTLRCAACSGRLFTNKAYSYPVAPKQSHRHLPGEGGHGLSAHQPISRAHPCPCKPRARRQRPQRGSFPDASGPQRRRIRSARCRGTEERGGGARSVRRRP